jgi:predicted nucleic-acid-binding protein
VIGIDTNILIRAAVGDDVDQAERARRFLATLTSDDPGYVSLVTLVEAVWVLQRAYRADREDVGRFIDTLLQSRELIIQASDVVRRALSDSRQSGSDFSDAVIALLGIDAGSDFTVTFDRRAAELPGMRLLE